MVAREAQKRPREKPEGAQRGPGESQRDTWKKEKKRNKRKNKKRNRKGFKEIERKASMIIGAFMCQWNNPSVCKGGGWGGGGR
jgi:hypothetical protein